MPICLSPVTFDGGERLDHRKLSRTRNGDRPRALDKNRGSETPRVRLFQTRWHRHHQRGSLREFTRAKTSPGKANYGGLDLEKARESESSVWVQTVIFASFRAQLRSLTFRPQVAPRECGIPYFLFGASVHERDEGL